MTYTTARMGLLLAIASTMKRKLEIQLHCHTQMNLLHQARLSCKSDTSTLYLSSSTQEHVSDALIVGNQELKFHPYQLTHTVHQELQIENCKSGAPSTSTQVSGILKGQCTSMYQVH